MGVKIVVTQEKFDEIVSIDEWLNFDDISHKRMYEILLEFVVDENGNPLQAAEARELFKVVPKKEWVNYITDFVKAVKDAFVNPTNGGS